MPKVVVVGSSNVDFTVAVDHLPATGETVSGGAFYQSFGGKGANQAVAARKAGADVSFLTKLGSDPNGSRIEAHLTSLGLARDTLLHDATTPTGVALIVVDHVGRNVIAVAPGSNRLLTVTDIRHTSAMFANGQVFLAQLEVPLPTVREALSLARAQHMITIVNPAPAQTLPQDIMELVDILTPNEREAQFLTGLSDPESAAKDLCARGVRSVVVTLGERGALLVEQEGSRLFPAYPVQPVDTTAAGDAFNGALACALAEGQVLEAAIPFANAAGALAATKRGAQDSLPARREIDQLCGRSG
jgi:ribokinase